MKPLIGIIAKNDSIIDDDEVWNYQIINSNVRYALLDQGAIAIGILPTNRTLQFSNEDDGKNKYNISLEEEQDLIQQLKLVDGVILQGGLYSDYYEEFVAKYCWDNDIPVIGICAGFNNIIRGLGGTTTDDIDRKVHSRKNNVNNAHEISIKKDSLLYSIIKQEKIEVNSIHTWAAKDVKVVEPIAFAPDGLIEAVEGKGKTFYLGLKFHPEFLYDDQRFKAIFTAFINKVKEKMNV